MKTHKDLTVAHEMISLFIYLPIGVLVASIAIGGIPITKFLLQHMVFPLSIGLIVHFILILEVKIPKIRNSALLHIQGFFGMMAFGAILVGFVNYF